MKKLIGRISCLFWGHAWTIHLCGAEGIWKECRDCGLTINLQGETLMSESLYANVDGDEVLLEVSNSYAQAFVKEHESENPDETESVISAIFIDGARWAIKNRVSPTRTGAKND